MRTRSVLWFSVLLIWAGFFGLHSAQAALPSSPEELFAVSGLTVLSIQTDSAQDPVDDLTGGIMTVYEPGSSQVKTVPIQIRLRGNTSRRFPKKSFRIHVVDAAGEKNHISIAGLRSDDDWILNPMYTDTSKIREMLAYELWDVMNRSGQDAASSRVAFVEILINGEYRGLYGVQERIDRKQVDADQRSGILYKFARLEEPSVQQLLDCTDPEICGGIELAFAGAGVMDPWEPAAAYMALLNGEEHTINAHVDPENLIDYGLWAMLTQAHDCHFKNQYLHCVLSTGGYTTYKIPWDVNHTFGDFWQNDAPETNYNAYGMTELTFDGLFAVLVELRDPDADAAIRNRWTQLRQTVIQEDLLVARANALFDPLFEALERDNERWPECGLGNGNAFNIRDIEAYFREILPRMDAYIGSLISE